MQDGSVRVFANRSKNVDVVCVWKAMELERGNWGDFLGGWEESVQQDSLFF